MKYIPHNYSESELEYKNFLSPSIERAINSLDIKEGALILDAGCGPGANLYPLLKATKNSGRIIAMDGSEVHLKKAKEIANEKNISGQVELMKHNLFEKLSFPNNYFDLIWISDVLFPDDTGKETITILKEVARVLKRGGQAAIFFGNWLRLQLLPGYSQLEHCISIGNELRKSKKRKWNYKFHPENGIEWLIELGFSNYNVSFHETLYKYPLADEITNYILWHFRNIYNPSLEYYQSMINKNDILLKNWRRITDPGSSDYILRKPGYYAKVSALLFSGNKC
jgi:SAM-dependent methyltransferase